MHEYEIKLLSFLKENRSASPDEIEQKLGIGSDAISWTIENLLAQKAVEVKRETSRTLSLSEEGGADLKEFPEERLARELQRKGGRESLANIKDQVALSWAKRNGWINIDKGIAKLTEDGTKIAEGKTEYRQRLALVKASKGEAPSDDIANELVKRGLLEIRERNFVKSVSITDSGIGLLEKAPKETGIGALSKEIIKNREWERLAFKPYNMDAVVEPVYPGRLHLLREFINVVRQNWFEMGFVEVSGPIIDAAFWNFDSLFSPQDHPTREMQDTFFLSNPKQLSIEDVELVGRVKKMHVNAWKEKWSEELAKSAVLRTHTTSVSAHYMKKLADAVDASYPLKLFSLGPVFRNENLDYKHLAEMRMCDGIIVGDGLTVANLIDTLKKFFGKIGIEGVKMRPSYFPFTEPSIEFFYNDKEHGDNVELAGSGVIRKEITKAMGLNKSVIAWGIGLDRLLLNSNVFGIDSITTPFKNNVGWLRSRPNLKV